MLALALQYEVDRVQFAAGEVDLFVEADDDELELALVEHEPAANDGSYTYESYTYEGSSALAPARDVHAQTLILYEEYHPYGGAEDFAVQRRSRTGTHAISLTTTGAGFSLGGRI